jgi:hypothetical protein
MRIWMIRIMVKSIGLGDDKLGDNDSREGLESEVAASLRRLGWTRR